MYKSTFSCHSRNLQICRCLSWCKSCVLRYLKSIEQVWYQDILYKLKQNGISVNFTWLLKRLKVKSCIEWTKFLWANAEAEVPQNSIVGPLLFLFYINDLPDNLSANATLFADNTLLFSVVHDVTISFCDLNYDLNRVREWAFQWKMSFNLEPSIQAQEVIFTRTRTYLCERFRKKITPHYILTLNVPNPDKNKKLS